ncbi:MAG: hypothetical protein CL851_06040 [Crocinitomicaceae bacterium]|nr:hypothetical protein [Crocinitomicaceae bacterium]|tara:strand:- start:2856 stop:3854 length:999 start_codon:yes stop_codon:yes gene_type:complete
MARQNISIGSSANDGTGDTLRSAGNKINQNFQEVYTQLGGDSSSLSTLVKLLDSSSTGVVLFEGTSADSHETKLIATNATADRTISLPNATGTIVLQDTTDTLTNKTLTSPVLTTPQINDTSADHQYILKPGELAADRNINLPVLSDSDTIVFLAATQTLTNKTITSPKIGTAINDTNGNEVVKITATSSAVNELTIANGAGTTGPALSATGGGSNLNLILTPKGTGSVSLAKAAYGSSTITANGAASTAATLIICNKSSALSVSLANGTTAGEFKIFTNKGNGLATVTPTSFANGTSFSLTTNHATQCIWDGAKWFMLNGADSSDNGISIT